jgi:hypothetical protein
LFDDTNLWRAYLPALSPDGKHLYISGGATSGTPDDGWVSVYERDALDGSLTFVQHRYEGELIGCYIICFYINGLSGAWGIAVSPDGNNVYVAGYNDDAVVRFIRDPFDGTLTYGGYVYNALAQDAPGPETLPEGTPLEGAPGGASRRREMAAMPGWSTKAARRTGRTDMIMAEGWMEYSTSSSARMANTCSPPVTTPAPWLCSSATRRTAC